MDGLYSVEAEMSALGAMMLSNRAAKELEGMMEAKYFYRPAHQIVFDAICDVLATGIEINYAEVIDSLRMRRMPNRESALKAIGGEDYILHLAEYCPSPTNSRYYAEHVIDFWVRREMVQIGKMAEEGDVPTNELKAHFTELTKAQDRSRAPKSGPLSDFIRGADTKGIPSGISLIDRGTTCKGLPIGQNTVVVAGTKGGKTACMLQVALRVAEAGFRVVYASFADLDANGLGKRALRHLCGRASEPIAGTADHADWCEAVQRIEKMPHFEVYDSSEDRHGRYLETFHSWVEGRRFAPQAVFFDYGQKLRSRSIGGRGSLMDHAEECSALCKWMAARHGFASIIGSQLTEGNAKEGKKDMTKGSRVWEEDAGLVLRIQILDKDAKVESQYQGIEGLAKISLPYSRFGPSGNSVMAQFMGERVGFQELI